MTKILALVGVCVVIVLLILPKLNKGGDKEAKSAGAAPVNSAQPVIVKIIDPQVLTQNISVTGSIEPNEEVNIRSEASGRITSISFDEGKAVQQGDLLLKINDSELQAQLLKVNTQIDLAQANERRQQQLFQKGGVSRESYERTATELSALKAERQYILSQIAKTNIRAPFDGVIGLRQVSEGSYISPADAVAVLVDSDPVKITFSIPESYAGVVNVGDSIEFSVESTGESYKGIIYAREPVIDVETRTLALKAKAPNPEGKIHPGSYADVKIVLKEFESAVMVPTEAIIPELGGQSVLAYRAGKSQPVNVETGIRRNEEIQITSGLEKGDTIIVSGILQARPGTSVQIKEVVE